MFAEIRELVLAGGWISVPLIAVSLAMWFVASLRLLNLRRGFAGDVTSCVRAIARRPSDNRVAGPVERYLLATLDALDNQGTCQHHLERFLRAEQDRVRDYGLVLTGCVTVAPLLGLLGTVNGMIETFASMQGVQLTRATEQSMAGGISVALISTQLGLVVGVPGFAVARLLARLEQRRLRELAQAHSVLIDARRVPP